MKMKRLSKDIVVKMALELTPPDLVNFCATEKEVYKNACDSDEFWRLKLEKDYPNLFAKLEKPILNPKEEYMKEFTFVSKHIEKTVDKIVELFYEEPSHIRESFFKYIDFKKYRKETYEFLYEKYKNMVLNDIEEDDVYFLIVEDEEIINIIPFEQTNRWSIYNVILEILLELFEKLIEHRLK
jgi:hypothetical protein